MRSRFVVVLIFTFLVRNGFTETDYEQTTFTLAASNTISGAKLIYKQSSSTPSSVLFDGLNISSSDVCGESYERCSIFLLPHEGILLSALPLGGCIGLVTFNTSEDQLTFREQHKIIISTSISCEISSIFLFTPLSEDLGFPTLLAVCQGVSTVELLSVTLTPTNLAQSISPRYFPQCSVTSPSEFVFFESSNLFDGVVVFVNNSGILLQRTGGSEECMMYDYPGVCSDVERFIAIPRTEHLQAIYCSTRTNLLDITINADMLDSDSATFSRSVDGLPMFCSGVVYCSYRGNNFTLHRVQDRTAVLSNPVEVLYEDEVVWGDCVVIDDQFYAVVQLRNSTVAAVLLNQGVVMDLGVSLFPPRIFEHSVLLIDSTRAAIFSLLDGKFSDSINGSFLLGAVINGDPIPVPRSMTSTDVMSTDVTSTDVTSNDVTSTDVTSTDMTTEPSFAFLGYAIAIPVVLAVLAVVLLLVVLIIICIVRLCSSSKSRIQEVVEMDGIIGDKLKGSSNATVTVTTPDANVTISTTTTTATTTMANVTATVTDANAVTNTTGPPTTEPPTTTTTTHDAAATTHAVTATTTTHAAVTATTNLPFISMAPPPAPPTESNDDTVDESDACAAARVLRLGNHHQSHAQYDIDLDVTTDPWQEHDHQHGTAESAGNNGEDGDDGERERQDGGGGGGGGRYLDNNNQWKLL